MKARESDTGVEREKRAGDRFAGVTALLVAVTAVPIVALVVPNTISYVVTPALRDLGLESGQAAGLVRANGMALPALLLAVPISAVAARRVPAWLVLLTGLLCVLAGEIAAQFAGSVPVIAAVRVIQGIGAGVILPATLILVWERHGRVLITLWAGVFTAALLLAMPAAMYAVPVPPTASAGPSEGAADGAAGDGWRAVLQPYPWLIGLALASVALLVILRVRTKAGPLPVLRHTERTQLLLPFVPAAGFAFLAVVTTYGWSPGAQLIVAGIGLIALVGLALAGTRNTTMGSPHGFAVVALTTGLLTLPVVAPLTGLVSTHSGPRGVHLAPFAAGAAAAVAAALLTARLRDGGTRTAVLSGHGMVIIAVLILLTVDAGSGTWLLTLPLVALGAGMGTALAASLRATGLGSALFGTALCFPAVLTGYLIVGPLQVADVNEAVDAGGGQREVVYALTSAFRVWLIIAGVITVLLAGGSILAGRSRRVSS
ncbi:hypothetical protein [Actinomadura sp. HBU206391]|uniref:hypothetical protein n=1 Tax=Actinomadura sp. HBU206391 TaxID=2731692 RepID=UPI00164FF519|nr:hypothetical protein [Actinomadura sp. HBU206391]MBC6461563.1 hypothetical protein [Actinomadura sp. HBU206391]